ncbi:alpha/beta fold hydrolase [Polycladidibacter hongkongensis]|uniref:alpha/beta fold hydrolase n=1 Tax=Polycladidibacter hongkongensis TaxID=1647556 RepID=UPI00155E2900|nr:alpha/beta fold hydrolase [Pseudovibrio hongkongensis]
MRNTLFAATAALTLLAPQIAPAQTMKDDSFRSEDEGEWYHSVEFDMWEGVGGNRQVLETIIEKIESTEGARRYADAPDTLIAYGPGNWTYEFSKAGDAAIAAAQTTDDLTIKQEAYNEAIVYYHLASSPHTPAPEHVAALTKAHDAYAASAQMLPGRFSRPQIPFEGKSFGAFLHIPEGNGPFPVVVVSQGSDVSKVVALPYYREHLAARGIAMLSIDVPGMGESSAYTVRDGRTDKLHAAAVDWVRAQDFTDDKNVFVQGVSFGGTSAARIFLARPELDLAGVIFMCGPINAPFLAGPDALQHLPPLTLDGVKSRMGMPLDTELAEFAKAIEVLALGKQGLFEGEKISTPLLAINTTADPVSPLFDMEKMLARAENGDKVLIDILGHCPPRSQRQPIIANWIDGKLR